MENVIPFPTHRTTTASRRCAQVIQRTRELTDARGGLQVGDRVRHLTYCWDGVLAAFDWKGGAIASHALVEVAFHGMPARMIPVQVEHLMKLYSIGEIA
jgi:hypothetical protein